MPPVVDLRGYDSQQYAHYDSKHVSFVYVLRESYHFESVARMLWHIVVINPRKSAPAPNSANETIIQCALSWAISSISVIVHEQAH